VPDLLLNRDGILISLCEMGLRVDAAAIGGVEALCCIGLICLSTRLVSILRCEVLVALGNG